MVEMKRVLVIIRDGWGHGKHDKGNAVFLAKTPNHDNFKKKYPSAVIKCTGNDVGNPKGVQGGSEVGHLTMGAGRIVWQPYELINRAIKDESFFENKILLSAIRNCIKRKSNLHISGLFSDQGVHANVTHLYALLELCKREKLDRVYIHLILDGRDMPEKSAIPLIKKLEQKIRKTTGTIASVCGRYYGMDRDTNWDRTGEFYDLLVSGKGFRARSAAEAVEKAYRRGEKTDYYIRATQIIPALVKDNDSFIFYNFRSDRARQITAMLNALPYYPKRIKPPKLCYVCFCSYDNDWKLPVAFPQEKIKNNLGNVIAQNNLKQLRIAETEKYAHVTFFFNSQAEEPNIGEKRIMVHSPKVPSYDLKPEMSAYGITEKLLPEIGKHDLIVLNYANPDLVGHSGVLKAAVKACEVVDACCGRIINKARETGHTVLLMADHGNSDHMLYDDGSKDPSHGFNPVLLTLISEKKHKLRNGGMKDIAPTILDVMGLKKPKEMDGESLIVG
ncbi:MAG: 2,3-bisphosphoglycerate-independent phosphoglycerate mutase [archaeon]